MATHRFALPRFVSVATIATLAVALPLVSHAQTGGTIRVWKVGSPHGGDTPDIAPPNALRREVARRGHQISVEAFPARGFAELFADAVARGDTPDVLVFDNFGVIEGITTAIGTFDGIGRDPAVRPHLVAVTGALDGLLGPRRGWTYLFAPSTNHDAVRALALEAPTCPSGSAEPVPQGELSTIVPTVAKAYLSADTAGLQPYTDPDRLLLHSSAREPATVGEVRVCGTWGSDRLAFATVNASYDSGKAIGATSVLLVLRRPAFQWQLLVAARDPVTNGPFVKDVSSMAGLLRGDVGTRVFPVPATLLSPAADEFPQPSAGQRFGNFAWRSSASDDVVAEVVEFAYRGDARLVLLHPVPPASRRQISAGQLWTTNGEWSWRIWSISSTGDVTFSDARSFQH